MGVAVEAMPKAPTRGHLVGSSSCVHCGFSTGESKSNRFLLKDLNIAALGTSDTQLRTNEESNDKFGQGRCHRGVGCQTNTGKGAGIGAAVGGILGGVIGHQSGRGLEGAAVGAAAGGAVGAAQALRTRRKTPTLNTQPKTQAARGRLFCIHECSVFYLELNVVFTLPPRPTLTRR